VSAQYEYGPFGEVIRATGLVAKANPFRFSTKYQDDETDLLYFGYRYYSSTTGRWLNKDPIAERGGRNLYTFVGNEPLSFSDRLGLTKCKKCDVKDISLKLFGFVLDPGGYYLHLFGKVVFKTQRDGKQYDSNCCKVIQFVKSKFTWNGKPYFGPSTGPKVAPMDGTWHVDVPDWTPAKDDPGYIGNAVPITAEEALDDGELLWLEDTHDMPGVHGFADDDTFDDQTSFEWRVYDQCVEPNEDLILVKKSRIVSYHVWSTNPPYVRYNIRN